MEKGLSNCIEGPRVLIVYQLGPGAGDDLVYGEMTKSLKYDLREPQVETFRCWAIRALRANGDNVLALKRGGASLPPAER